jgi:hypothetical protein
MPETMTEEKRQRVPRGSRPYDYWPAVPEESGLNLVNETHLRILLGAAGIYISIRVIEGRVTAEKLVHDLRISQLRDPSQRGVSALLDDPVAMPQLSESIINYFVAYPGLPYYLQYCKGRSVTNTGKVQNEGVLVFDTWVGTESQEYIAEYNVRLLREFLQRCQDEELQYGSYIYDELPSLPEGSIIDFEDQDHFRLMLEVARNIKQYGDDGTALTEEEIRDMSAKIAYVRARKKLFKTLVENYDEVFREIVTYFEEHPLLASYLVGLVRRGNMRELGYIQGKNVSPFLVWRVREILRQEYRVDSQFAIAPEDRPGLQQPGKKKHRGRRPRSKQSRYWRGREEVKERQ